MKGFAPMRLAAVSAACLALLTLTGCVGAFDPFQRPGNWAEEGSANETIAQQAANPGDLISGTSDPMTEGGLAVTPLNNITSIEKTGGGSSGSSGGSSGGSGGSSGGGGS